LYLAKSDEDVTVGGDTMAAPEALEKVPGPHLCVEYERNVVQLLYESTQSASMNTKETGDTPQGNERQRKLEAVYARERDQL
jgi:hypothetical protein